MLASKRSVYAAKLWVSSKRRTDVDKGAGWCNRSTSLAGIEQCSSCRGLPKCMRFGKHQPEVMARGHVFQPVARLHSCTECSSFFRP